MNKVVNYGLRALPLILISALCAKPALPIPERGGMSPYRTRSLSPSVFLADGTEFRTWEPVVIKYSRSYYVRQNFPGASDSNPGTAEHPFLTIHRASEVLLPGEHVLIDAGVYREVIQPVRGGDSPMAMIGYEAMAGTHPVVSGAEIVPSVGWGRVVDYRVPDEVAKKIRVLRIPERVFPSGAEPFATHNLSAYMTERFARKGWVSQPANIASAIGYATLLLQDGRRLTQCAGIAGTGDFITPPLLIKAGPGHFWPDPDGRTVYVWPFDDADPAACVWEVAARQHCVDPLVRGLGFLQFKGLTFENTGNPFPMPQSGMISTGAGNHWIIEGNHLRRANGVGIDLGASHWTRTTPPLMGNHIVRDNLIEECGIGGICGTGTPAASYTVQIENNLIRGVSYQPVDTLQESAAIKLHFALGCLIRGNTIEDTAHGSGIWLDNNVANNRVTGNLLVNTRAKYGAIFIELTEFANLVDSNVIIGGAGAGIYEHDSGSVIVAHNLVANVDGPAVRLLGGVRATERSAKLRTGGHRVVNNLFVGCKTDVAEHSADTVIEQNHHLDAKLVFDMATLSCTWPFTGSLATAPSPDAVREDFWGRPAPTPVAGPFGRNFSTGQIIPLRPAKVVSP